jgi:hypothetical protein
MKLGTNEQSRGRGGLVTASQIKHLTAGALDAEMGHAAIVALDGDARLADFFVGRGGGSFRPGNFERLEIRCRRVGPDDGDVKFASGRRRGRSG